MKLHEYQSKNIYSKYGIPIPRGRVASTVAEARQVSEELGGRVVLKAQVLIGGRGKAGGVRLVKTSEEAEEFSTQILGMNIKGLPVRKLLIEEAVPISREIYLAITNDRTKEMPILLASSEGGIDIEKTAQQAPDKIYRKYIDPLVGLRDYQIRDVALNIDLPRIIWKEFGEIINFLWRVYVDNDATLVEINPLVITSENHLVALDAKIVLDDNSIFRHPDLTELRDIDADDRSEIAGRKFGVSFIKLDGNIGCLVNGAGLAMATMDIIKHFGAEPANFLDIGGGASAEKVAASLRLILSDPNVKAILVNVFGGITRCDEVAKGLVTAYAEIKTNIPIVSRLVGTNEEEGRRILSGSSLIYADSLVDAAQKAVSLVNGEVI